MGQAQSEQPMESEGVVTSSNDAYDQAALDEASRELHLFMLREGSSWGTKACEEIGRVFMTAYWKAAQSESAPLSEEHRISWQADVNELVAARKVADELRAELAALRSNGGTSEKELARLREIEHRVWHVLDDSEEDATTGNISITPSDDYLKLCDLLPEDHPSSSQEKPE